MDTNIHTYIHTYIHVIVYIYIYTYTLYIYIYMYTYIVCTYIYIEVLTPLTKQLLLALLYNWGTSYAKMPTSKWDDPPASMGDYGPTIMNGIPWYVYMN